MTDRATLGAMQLHHAARLAPLVSTRSLIATVVLMALAGHGLRAQAPAPEQAVRQVEDRRIKAMLDDDFATIVSAVREGHRGRHGRR